MAKNATLNSFKKILGKDASFIMSEEEDNPYHLTETFDTGCYALNAILSDGDIYKGPHLGKRIGLSGPSSVGKSYFSAALVKKFLDKYENSNVIVWESEGATLKEMCENFDIDMNRILAVPVETLEDFKTKSLALLEDIREKQKKAKADKEPEPMFLFLLDSLGQLDTERDFKKTREGTNSADMGYRAQVVRSIFRKITLILSLTKTTLVVVNHSFENPGSMYSEIKSGGGEGFRFAVDLSAIITKAQLKEGDKRVGNILKLTIEKSRFIKDKSSVKINVSYKNGIHPYSNMLTFAEQFGVIKKEGHSFVFKDGSKVKMKEVGKNIEKYLTKDVMDELREKIKGEFSFGCEETNLEDELESNIEVDEE